ncbi:MAG: SRPBCC family protein [Candidatus Aminicenantes bacterium]|nr:MAG: SRPBCC family protein [Candidatus Aminicenantes bacterium]
MELKHSIEIKTSPEKIWAFFVNLEQNYTTWHPEDHVSFKWIKGKPWEEGSAFYAEQYAKGKLTKFKGTVCEVIPNRKIVFKFSFPISLISPKIEWLIEPKGSNSVFTAITHARAGVFFGKIFKKHWKNSKELHDKHTGEEGENLKKILESEN